MNHILLCFDIGLWAIKVGLFWIPVVVCCLCHVSMILLMFGKFVSMQFFGMFLTFCVKLQIVKLGILALNSLQRH